MRRLIPLLIIALMFLPTLGAIASAQMAEKGPATNEIIWKAVPLSQVAEALKTGQIDVYLFGLRPSAAQQLANQPGITLYQAPSGLVDIGLNPAPVMIVQLPGKYDKAAAAKELGVNPVVVEYATYIPSDANLTLLNNAPFIGIQINKTDVTIVELCAKPLHSLPGDAKVLWQSNKMDINPFCFPQIRFALNYLINRKFIVQNIYKGFAIAKYACYGPDDPTYTSLVDIVAKYQFSYNPEYAKRLVSEVLTKAGAVLKGGTWYYNGKPITVIGIIRQEDERYDIGNFFSDQLEKVLGFKVQRQYLPFTEAIPKVYFTDPKDFQWSFYTEGWGKGVLDRWDPWVLAQFGADWLGWAPGWGETNYWNYRNYTIDYYSMLTANSRIDPKNLEQSNYLLYLMLKEKGLIGDKPIIVTNKQQWINYLRKGTELSILQSIRIWIAATMSIYPAKSDIKGVTLDLGAGLRNPFFYRGAYIPGKNTLVVGHLHVYTAGTVWNPFGGFTDVYSADPLGATWDPWVWRHPFNGEPMPFRVTYTVETAGPTGKLKVPDDAIWWDAKQHKWVYAKDLGRTEAVSKVVFDLSKFIGTKWQDGQTITWADVLAYWATWLDLVYNPQKASLESSIAGPNRQTFDKIVAIRILPDQNKLEVYVNYWHFDPNYIADFVTLSYYVPAEIMFASDYLAFHAKTYALSDTRAKNSNIPQLNLVLKKDADDVVKALEEINFDQMYKSYITLPNGEVPGIQNVDAWWHARVEAVKKWVDEYGNAWISDGPFKLVEFNKDKQELKLEAYRDPSYPFGPTTWVFGLPKPTTISKIVAPLVEPGRPARITVSVSGLPPLHVKWILRDPATGKILGYGVAEQGPTGFIITLPANLTSKLAEYAAYELTVIAYSDKVALPAQKTVVIQTTARVSQAVSQLQTQLQQTQKQVQQLQQQLQQQAQQLQKQAEELKKLAEQLANLQSSLGKALAGQLQQLTSSLVQQMGKLTTGVTQTVNTLGKQITEVSNALAKLGQQVGQLNSQVSKIEQQISGLPVNVATTKDVQKAVNAADKAASEASAAASKANLALVISIINLILLLILLGVVYSSRKQ